jgi:hypothetical protein
MKRILIAGILAGLAMFVWEFVAHMVTPLGEMGLSVFPNEAAARAALAAQLGNADGLYIFPSTGMDQMPTPGPAGLLLYHPQFTFSWWAMAWEALVELAEGLVLALLIGLSGVAGFGRRLAIALLVGVVAAIAVSPSYTIWFGFPISYTLAQMIVAFGDYVVGGLVVAWLMKSNPASTT